MTEFLRAVGQLRATIKPDVDDHTRKVELEGEKTIGEILEHIPLNPAFVAPVYVDGAMKDLRQAADGRMLRPAAVSGG